jgi:hypothetical protein
MGVFLLFCFQPVNPNTKMQIPTFGEALGRFTD